MAEGIEKKRQLQLLVEKDCDLVQGFMMGRPVTAHEFQATYLG